MLGALLAAWNAVSVVWGNLPEGSENVLACIGGSGFALVVMFVRGHSIPWPSEARSLPTNAGWFPLFLAVVIYTLFTYPAARWLYGAADARQWFMAAVAAIEIVAGRGLWNGFVDKGLANSGGTA
jgi:hypothetical protein